MPKRIFDLCATCSKMNAASLIPVCGTHKQAANQPAMMPEIPHINVIAERKWAEYRSERFFAARVTTSTGGDVVWHRDDSCSCSRVYGALCVCVCCVGSVCAIVHSNKNKLPDGVYDSLCSVAHTPAPNSKFDSRNGMSSEKDVQLKTIMANTFHCARVSRAPTQPN